jgi:polysaccharide export outer membrane protein
MYRFVSRSLPFIVVLAWCATCYAQEDPTPTPTSLSEIDQISLVHFGDIVDVDFVGSGEYDWRGGVSPEGDLEGLDEVGGPIAAVCRSEQEIAAEIEKIYGRLLRSPRVVVRIVDRSNRPMVVVDGAVRTPTRFRLLRPVTLRELIVRTGGFTDAASGTIRLTRPPRANCVRPDPGAKDNTPLLRVISITDLLAGRPDANVQLLSGDMVEILKGDPVYVIGAVVSPRPVYLKPEMTLLRAVASAGGVLRDSSGRVTVFRRQPGSEAAATDVDLNKIKRGEAVDLPLLPFDIIDVAGKPGNARKFAPFRTGSDLTSQRELPLRVID